MKDRLLKIRKWEDLYANYDTKYMAEVTHEGLKEHRVLSDRDPYILHNKITSLRERWESRWKRIYEKQQKDALISDLSQKAEIEDQDAKSYIEDVETLLHFTLEIDDTVDWDTLKDKSEFTEIQPKKPTKPEKTIVPKSAEPNPSSIKYTPKFSFLDRLLSKRKEKKQSLAQQLYLADLENFKKDVQLAEDNYNKDLEQYENQLSEYNKECSQIDKKRAEFYEQREATNKKVDAFKAKYVELDPEAVEEYCELVLNNSQYPSAFPQSFILEYNRDNKSIIVDYWLPNLEQMPSVKEVKFIKTKGEIKPVELSDAQRRKLFDSSVYQIALRTIHELFEADSAQALEIITFNGFINHINKSTGKEENSCIVSLQADKEEFMAIDLSKVEPKECFKGLKGIGSSKLNSLTPIKPILKMDRNDSRIASHYTVVGDIDDSVNLASMDWEDFEHLVRELFAKEFSGEGSEVHVTRASKDGGVDAIAFDPDPIRGGKIVIQAKRYTNTVGVAAVRDLYGTVLNEGAIKGILVTTSNYGPDAYNFAKDKPLALLNGNNLLHLLMSQGVKARINLKEAKEQK